MKHGLFLIGMTLTAVGCIFLMVVCMEKVFIFGGRFFFGILSTIIGSYICGYGAGVKEK